jgi:hypothetical protein
MDYYLKYIKYKTKYLALKGGAQYNLIKEHNPIYNLKSCFEYKKNDKINETIVTNYFLLHNGEITINQENKIPFNTLFLQNSSNIIPKLHQLLTNKYFIPVLINEIKNENNELVKRIDKIIANNNEKHNCVFNENAYKICITMKYINLKKQIKYNNNLINIESMKESFDNIIETYNATKYIKAISNDIIYKNKIICNMIQFTRIIKENDYSVDIEDEVESLMKSIDNTFRTYFNINQTCFAHIINNVFNANILNKYIFINKFRELLEILYSDIINDDELKNQINKLYDGVSDKMILYNNFINEIDYTKLDKKNYFDISINNEIILIKELKKFIKYCDIIDNTQKCTICLGIKTSLIFFASFIGAHFDKLSISKITNSSYPINIDNLIYNLLQKN